MTEEPAKLRFRTYGIGLLALLGFAQMAGDLLHLPALKGIAAATAASPAPRVFSAVRGLETYSTHFFLEWTSREGTAHSIELTPERYARLRGPYNRRNIYGAVLAYGPVLVSDARTRPLFEAVAAYALCGRAPLLDELGIPHEAAWGPLRLRLQLRPGASASGLPLLLEPPCR
jgi:hypothetical protein